MLIYGPVFMIQQKHTVVACLAAIWQSDIIKRAPNFCY
jgi:hypothetical protein